MHFSTKKALDFAANSVHTTTAMPEDSCADLTEDTAAGSGSEAECTAHPEEGTTTARHGPLRAPTPPQVAMAAARARSKKAKRKGKRSEGGRTDKGASSQCRRRQQE